MTQPFIGVRTGSLSSALSRALPARERCRARGLDVPAWRFALHGLLLAVPTVAVADWILAWTAGT